MLKLNNKQIDLKYANVKPIGKLDDYIVYGKKNTVTITFNFDFTINPNATISIDNKRYDKSSPSTVSLELNSNSQYVISYSAIGGSLDCNRISGDSNIEGSTIISIPAAISSPHQLNTGVENSVWNLKNSSASGGAGN